jgi:DnaJ-class molecular chaperone
MVTIYDLLEVSEDASKEEIEKAYSRMVLEFRQDINFDSEKEEKDIPQDTLFNKFVNWFRIQKD